MGITGKYDFPGIKKAGAAGLSAALATTVWGAWILKFGGGKLLDWVIGLAINWLTNKGLIFLNVGAIYVNGELDQNALDKALDDGWKKVEAGGLTPEEGKAIDDKVIAAADKALPYSTKPNKP